MPPTIKTVIIGISGPSSSGKTTLARLLRRIFDTLDESLPNSLHTSLFVLHSDDFYKRDVDLPQRQITSPEHGTRTFADWDCVEALNLPELQRSLQHISQYGRLPAGLESKEDKNSTGDSKVSSAEIERYRDDLISFLSTLSNKFHIQELRVCLLDGFLLYPAPSPSSTSTSLETETNSMTSSELLIQLHDILEPLLTLKLFLSSTRAQTIERRAARAGYVTMEGFWKDPPGYVEDLVWPNYARDHGWMFRNREDVDEGIVNVEAARKEGVLVGPGKGDVSMSEVLNWGMSVLKGMVARVVDGEETKQH